MGENIINDNQIELNYDPYLWAFIRSDIVDNIQPYTKNKLCISNNSYTPMELFEIFINIYVKIRIEYKKIKDDLLDTQKFFYDDVMYSVFFSSNNYFDSVEKCIDSLYHKNITHVKIVNPIAVQIIADYFYLFKKFRRIKKIKKSFYNNFKLFYSQFEPFIRNINSLNIPLRTFIDVNKTYKMSAGENAICKHLTYLSTRHKLYFANNFKFKCFQQITKYSFDFFCILIHNSILHPFVIEFDGEQHFNDNHNFFKKSLHSNDIIKQFYLCNINVHLLRITKKLHIQEAINNFIYFITHNHHQSYISFNYINPRTDFTSYSFDIYNHPLFINIITFPH